MRLEEELTKTKAKLKRTEMEDLPALHSECRNALERAEAAEKSSRAAEEEKVTHALTAHVLARRIHRARNARPCIHSIGISCLHARLPLQSVFFDGIQIPCFWLVHRCGSRWR